MKHKKIQKKGTGDNDDTSGIDDEDIENTSFETTNDDIESPRANPTSHKFSRYDVESLVKCHSPFPPKPSVHQSDSENENEEIDVVESDPEGS